MAGEAEVAKVGVALIVQNLAKFKNDMGGAGNALGSLKTNLSLVQKAFAAITPKTTLLEKAFKSLGSSIKNFAQNIVGRILTIAFGVLVRDAFRKVISVIGEMVRAVYEGGDAFQRLEIRLNRFNMNALKESGMAANEIIAETTRLTKEQIQWALDLAGLTIYDSADIANAYSLARSYGFIDKEARSLTEDILSFTSGMGLSGMQIERIITNLGQMVQQGKITGTELRDLARGSLVPVNKILGIIAESMGMTTEELNKMRKAGTTDPQWFVQAFGMFVGEDFAGATEDMAKSFTGAMDNVKDIFVGRLSAMVSSPVMSKLGQKLSDILLGFYSGKKVKPEFARSFERIGASLVRIIDKLFGLIPSANSIADAIIKAFSGIATWLEKNEDTIVNWIRNAIKFLGDLAYTIKVLVIPAIMKVVKWLWDNGDALWFWAKVIGIAWLAWQGFVITLRIGLGLIVLLVGALIRVTTAIIGYRVIVAIVNAVQSAWGANILITAGNLIKMATAAKGATVATTALSTSTVAAGAKMAGIGAAIRTAATGGLIASAILLAGMFWTWFGYKLSQLGRQAFAGTWWGNLGEMIIQGITVGVMDAAMGLYNAMIQIANTVMSIWNSIWGMHSPSKVMEESGVLMMEGLAKGLLGGVKNVLGVTDKVASAVFGSFGGSGSSEAGITNGGNGGQYLNNQGEVMRSNMDVVKGDPCAKDSTAGCLAESLSTAIGGVGAGITSALTSLAERLVEIFGEESKANNEAYTKELANTRFGFNTDAMNLANGTAATISGESKRLIDGSLMLQKEVALTVTDRLTSIHDNALADLLFARNDFVAESRRMGTEFSSTMGKVLAAVVNFIAGQATTNTSTPPPTGTTSNASSSTSSTSSSSAYVTNNVTNNFNGSQAGQQITWDFEAGQFWV
jgi:tape measure domain-containing protein